MAITNLISRINVELWISEKNTKTDNQIPIVTTGRSQNFELINNERKADVMAMVFALVMILIPISIGLVLK